MAFATGGLGLKPDEFWRLTWAEYDVMCEGYAKEREREYKEQWEATRWMTFHLINIQLDKRHKLKRLTELVRFPWDKKTDFVPSTRERFEELKKKWGETLA